MTKKEYKAILKDADSKIKEQEERKNRAREDFINASYSFKVGDKVIAIWNAYKHPFSEGKTIPERRIICAISSVNDKYFNGEIKYDFVKVKKDGTISKQSAGIYGGYDRLELLEPAKPPQL